MNSEVESSSYIDIETVFEILIGLWNGPINISKFFIDVILIMYYFSTNININSYFDNSIELSKYINNEIGFVKCSKR